MVVNMDELLQDYQHWGVLAYDKFPSQMYDPFRERYITVGYIVVHQREGTLAYVADDSRRELKNILTSEDYDNLDYFKIIYKLRNSFYSNGYFSLKSTGLPKNWVHTLFNSSFFQQGYAKYALADMDFNYMRDLLDDYVNRRIILGESQKQQVLNFVEEVMFQIFIEREKEKCIFHGIIFGMHC